MAQDRQEKARKLIFLIIQTLNEFEANIIKLLANGFDDLLICYLFKLNISEFLELKRNLFNKIKNNYYFYNLYLGINE